MAARGKAAKTTGQLVLVRTGKGPQKRARRDSDWNAAMERRFAEVLADTCNVTLAGEAIKRTSSSVYRHRARSAAFRALWDGALATGYSKLELMMLQRALHGQEKVVTGKDGSTSVMREYPDRVALALLKMHRERVDAQENTSVNDAECEEARERILARLERIRERAMEEQKADCRA